MKKLKYKIRAAIVRFFLKCCTVLRGHCYCTNHFYYETKYIQIKELQTGTDSATNKFSDIPMGLLLAENIRAPHKVATWKELFKSIKTSGIKVNPQVVKSKYGYEIYDGNHRIKILESLYGREHKVKVDVYLVHEKHIPYYTTMGNAETVEFKKLMLKKNLQETENKMYGPE